MFGHDDRFIDMLHIIKRDRESRNFMIAHIRTNTKLSLLLTRNSISISVSTAFGVEEGCRGVGMETLLLLLLLLLCDMLGRVSYLMDQPMKITAIYNISKPNEVGA